VISLSKAMGLSLIAEGVETEQQRDFLAKLGSHAFQGHLFSPALPLRDFELLLAEASEKAVLPPLNLLTCATGSAHPRLESRR
jgi:EAL domain-containing protein (putative c-di-GMP-specific phosphodiesterase class I)